MSYDTILPIGILLVQGGYQDNKDAYVLPHSGHQPSAHILKRLWPWADAALAEVTRVSVTVHVLVVVIRLLSGKIGAS
jgi:hypothetical protein